MFKEGDRQATPFLAKCYVAVVAFLLPIDWFSPTGELFREFGAKPATMVLSLGGIVGLLLRPPVYRGRTIEHRAILLLAGLVVLGLVAFFINVLCGWSSWSHARDPLSQFINQSALLAICGIAVLGNARLAMKYSLSAALNTLLPWVAGAHLVIFWAEALELISDSTGPLRLFRTEDGEITLPTGLTSEPSYFGTLAALLGTALLFTGARGGGQLISALLALTLYISALSVGGKTFFAVLLGQAAFLIIRRDTHISIRVTAYALLGLVVTGMLYFSTQFSAFSVEENLSTANRLGSPLLALTAAAQGYGVTGIGTGQFHFLFKEEFAPSFLFLSSEALNQFSLLAESRASTYNVYARILLELGVVGFLFTMVSLYVLFTQRLQHGHLCVQVLLAGAAGFLLTQDTYFYPPLVFGAALVLGHMYRQGLK